MIHLEGCNCAIYHARLFAWEYVQTEQLSPLKWIITRPELGWQQRCKRISQIRLCNVSSHICYLTALTLYDGTLYDGTLWRQHSELKKALLPRLWCSVLSALFFDSLFNCIHIFVVEAKGPRCILCNKTLGKGDEASFVTVLWLCMH